MVSTLKKNIIRVIGYVNYRKILTSVMRGITKVDSKLMHGKSIEDVQEYSVSGRDVFFGYYDLMSLDPDNTKLLSMAVSDNDSAADVGYFDVGSGKFFKVAETNAWNWQMGSRLRWFEDGKSIMFNDFDGTEFISRVVDISGKELKRYPYPLFDVDLASGIGYFTDFTILHHLRDGYGYSNKKVSFEEYYRAVTNGVYKVRLEDDVPSLVISVDDLKHMEPTEDMKEKYHYINHITVNPYNGDVMFFHLWTDGKDIWKNRMVFMNENGEQIRIISDFDRASHYTWQDTDHILVSLYTGDQTEYRCYDYQSGEYELLDGIKTDGHPSYINKCFFITDTYPNRCAMQSIYICDSKERTYKNLFSVYHSPSKVGSERCALHPRVKGNIVNIDSAAGKRRSQYLMRLNCDLRGSAQWDRRLLRDKEAAIEAEGPKNDSLFACMDSEYRFATGRPRASKLKIIKLFTESPVFRANVYVAQMQKTKSKRKKRFLRNKLEAKYAMIVDQNCKLGIHFRADHAIGIVIGSGAVVGKYCKIYQNVTIGQKSGRFPVIGDHVVIYAGAKIIGDVKIGDYAVIGANAVVTKDVPEGAVAVGIPAHNILRGNPNEQA